jgi:hypothetical protein
MSMSLDILRDKNSTAKLQNYGQFLEHTAKIMISDFDKLKQVVNSAITSYLIEIKYKFFRNQGRERAEKLQKKIQKSNDTLELISALKETISEGNENSDSFKTFLYRSINLNFCERKIAQLYPYPKLCYTDFLENIISVVQKRSEPICLTTFKKG